MIVLLTSGGDWTDASAEMLVVPDRYPGAEEHPTLREAIDEAILDAEKARGN